MVQLSHPYMITRKTMALTRQNFVGKVRSLVFNTQSRFIIAFLPRSKCLLISWLLISLSTVILESKKIKSATVSIFSPSICQEVMVLDAMILVFWMLSFKPASSLSSVTFIKRFLSSSLFGEWCIRSKWQLGSRDGACRQIFQERGDKGDKRRQRDIWEGILGWQKDLFRWIRLEHD